jgi:hypothetical protein
MIKLTDQLNEVNIAPAVDKAKLLGKIANYSLYLLSYLTYSNSNVNEFLDNYGYNDMKEFEQEEDVELFEIEIDDVTYCTNNDESGFIKLDIVIYKTITITINHKI